MPAVAAAGAALPGRHGEPLRRDVSGAQGGQGPQARPLKRAAAEPAIRYTYQSQCGLDDYLARNRTTGLLILKDDTILVERYQYDRTPEHRMHSYSMAKTVVAMLVGVALAEGKIQSLDDRAEKYVAELKGTPYGETPIRHLLTMSSGVRFSENYSGTDDVATLARLSVLGESEGGAATVMPFRTRDRAPGERFSLLVGGDPGARPGAACGDGNHRSPTTCRRRSGNRWAPRPTPPGSSTRGATRWPTSASTPRCGTTRGSACCSRTTARSTAGRSSRPAGCATATTPPAKQFEPGQTGVALRLRLSDVDRARQAGQERQFALRGLRGQGVFVDPKSKLVMVHTAAGDVGDPGLMVMLELWFGVVDSLGK